MIHPPGVGVRLLSDSSYDQLPERNGVVTIHPDERFSISAISHPHFRLRGKHGVWATACIDGRDGIMDYQKSILPNKFIRKRLAVQGGSTERLAMSIP